MTVTVDPITLQLAFQRLEFETGFDINAVIDERDRYKAALDDAFRDISYIKPGADNSWAGRGIRCYETLAGARR